MGYVYADIILKNTYDVLKERSGYIQEPEVRQVLVHALVDTGSGTLVINEALRQELGLEINKKQWITLADNTAKLCTYADPVEIHWQDRQSMVQPIVMDDAKDVLLGAIPLQEMDLIVHPAEHTLVGTHGDKPMVRA